VLDRSRVGRFSSRPACGTWAPPASRGHPAGVLASPVLPPTASAGAAEADTAVDETREQASELVKEGVDERPGHLPTLALDGTGHDRRRLVHHMGHDCTAVADNRLAATRLDGDRLRRRSEHTRF
jgi:hypothetical protein